MSRKLHRPNLDKKGLVVPIKQGGTYGRTVAEADDSLGIVTTPQINVANGIAGLDGNGRILSSQVPSGVTLSSIKISGPSLVIAGTRNKYTITDYDQYTNYTVTASSGFISRSGDTIYYTAPNTSGNYSFTVNGKTISVTVDNRYVEKPSIVTPSQDFSLAGATMNFNSSDLNPIGFQSYKSLRFKGVNNGLNKSYSVNKVDTDNHIKTFSIWFKLSSLGTNRVIMSNSYDANNYWAIMFDSNNKLWLGCNNFNEYGSVVLLKVSTLSFTDITSWQHLVVTIDTTNAVAEDRVKAYINNTRITSWDTNTVPSLNNHAMSFLSPVTSTWSATIGYGTLNTYPFNGYMSEINVIDGLALDPSYFAQTDPELGILVPKTYIGSYGTNGFYLDFKDTGSLIDLPKDKSGNNNHWATNNVSLTAGSTYDAMLDGPTTNCHTLNAADILGPTSSITSGGLETTTGTTGYLAKRGIAVLPSSGKWYWEVVPTAGTEFYIGLSRSDSVADGVLGNNSGGQINGLSYCHNGTKGNNGFTTYGATYGINDAIGIAADMDAGTLTFYKNGVSQGIAFNNLLGFSWYAAFSDGSNSNSSSATFNFGQRPFSYTPPLGFKSLATPILHDSTDWQLSDKADFSNIISQVATSSSNKQSWTVSDLSLSKDYFVKCRYNSGEYGVSEWSDVRHFKTRSAWLPLGEQQILTASDKAASDQFGVSVAFTQDGSRLAIGAYNKTVGGITGAGQVYTYTRSGSVYTAEATISASDKAVNDNFGASVSFTADGSRLAIGAYNKTVGGTAGAGQVYVYTRSGSVYTAETTISASDKAANDHFGSSVSWTADGSRLAIGAYNKTVSAVTLAGQVYTYTRSGSVYTAEATISAGDKVSGDKFGLSVAFTADGSRLAVGAYAKTVSSITAAGQAYIYTRSGSTYTQEATISAADKATNDWFGVGLGFTSDGSRLYISCYQKTTSGVTSCGQVYVYNRLGATYSLDSTITASDKAASDGFGRIAVSGDGALLAVGADLRDSDGLANSGAVYIFS